MDSCRMVWSHCAIAIEVLNIFMVHERCQSATCVCLMLLRQNFELHESGIRQTDIRVR